MCVSVCVCVREFHKVTVFSFLTAYFKDLKIHLINLTSSYYKLIN